mmetsp:Transcript_2610/g.3055  ORF Transcript_2610/g.3055 Transcript_2610/m.3055 type:complete len:158 (+) Transcript_2610:451-924(+)
MKIEKLLKKERNIFANNTHFFEFVKEFAEKEGINITDEEFKFKLFPIILYYVFKSRIHKIPTTYYNSHEKSRVLRELKAFKKFNDPRGSSGDERSYAVSHISIAFARLLTLNHEDCKTFFWSKICGRKGFKVDNIDRFKAQINYNIELHINLGDLSL